MLHAVVVVVSMRVSWRPQGAPVFRVAKDITGMSLVPPWPHAHNWQQLTTQCPTLLFPSQNLRMLRPVLWLAIIFSFSGIFASTALAKQRFTVQNPSAVFGDDQIREGTHTNLSTLHLSSITYDQEYVALTHSRFPYHRVRVKKTNFCDPTVKWVFPFRCSSNILMDNNHLACIRVIWMWMLEQSICSSTSSKVEEILTKARVPFDFIPNNTSHWTQRLFRRCYDVD